MSKNLSKLFTCEREVNTSYNPDGLDKGSIIKSNNLLRPSAKSSHNILNTLTTSPSMDNRIIEALEPDIDDVSILEPEVFNDLLDKAQNALQKEVQIEEPSEKQESLTSLLSLLKDNSDLMSLFRRYANLIMKV